MKKYILIIGLSVVLAGCSSNTGADNTTAQSKTEESAKETTEGEEEEKEEDTTAEEAQNDARATVEETVLYDQDGVKVTLNGIDFEGSFFGPELNVLIENNSDKTVTVQTSDGCSINGYMADPMLSCEVTAGKKANDTITLSGSIFENANITDIATIDLKLHVYDSEAWKKIGEGEFVTVNTSIVETYVQEYDDSGEVIFEAEGIKVISKGLREEESLFGPEIEFYVENNSDKEIYLQAGESSINGFMVDGMMSCNVRPGKKAITSLSFFSSDLEANGIEAIEEIDLIFKILDSGFGTIATSDMITLNLNQDMDISKR